METDAPALGTAHPPDATEAILSEPAAQRMLLVSGLALAALLATYANLLVNVPAGAQTAYGLHPPSIELFRRLWPYPIWELSPVRFTGLASLTQLLAWLVYFVALGSTSLASDDRSGRRARGILAGCAALSLALVFYFPTVLSADVFHYALHGRMISLHGWNPYVVSGDAMRGDPFHYLAVWRDIRTQYGPLWTGLAAVVTRIGDDHVLATVLFFKALAASGHVASAALVWLIARKLPNVAADRALLLYAWNPLLLLESAGSGHNDFVMLALALAGSLSFISRRFTLGLLLLLASAGVKYITLLLAFSSAAHALGLLPNRDRVRAAATWIAAGLMLVILLYAPFLSGAEGISQLWAGLAPDTNPMPNNVGIAARRLLSLPFDPEVATRYGNLLLNLIFACGMLLHGRRCLRPAATWNTVFSGYAMASFVYAFVIFAGSLPWYLLSPIAAAGIAGRGRLPFYLLATSFGLGIGFMLQNVRLLPN